MERSSKNQNGGNEFFSNCRMKMWKQELKRLCEKTGISMDDICKYMGVQYSTTPGFYRKLPKHRETYIGIGMACGLSLERINRWIVQYGGKKRLYVKDVLNDLIWIYLIHVNFCGKKHLQENYYHKFEACRDSMEAVYQSMNIESEGEDVPTCELDEEAKRVVFDPEYAELKRFVKKNIRAFHSAYARPKKLLTLYIQGILLVKNEIKTGGRKWTLNSLRGDLDDSMINYLTSGIKYVPKSKKTHISVGLAIGMTAKELDEYLQMMGYAPLDATYPNEGMLLELLENWESAHPLQRCFKEKYLKGNSTGVEMDGLQKLRAVDEMLGLRSDLKEVYEKSRELRGNCGKCQKFPYMSE